MKYDFTSIINRMGKDASAVESVGIKRIGNEPDKLKEAFESIRDRNADKKVIQRMT